MSLRDKLKTAVSKATGADLDLGKYTELFPVLKELDALRTGLLEGGVTIQRERLLRLLDEIPEDAALRVDDLTFEPPNRIVLVLLHHEHGRIHLPATVEQLRFCYREAWLHVRFSSADFQVEGLDLIRRTLLSAAAKAGGQTNLDWIFEKAFAKQKGFAQLGPDLWKIDLMAFPQSKAVFQTTVKGVAPFKHIEFDGIRCTPDALMLLFDERKRKVLAKVYGLMGRSRG